MIKHVLVSYRPILTQKTCAAAQKLLGLLAQTLGRKVRDTLTSWLGRLWHEELEAHAARGRAGAAHARVRSTRPPTTSLRRCREQP